MNRRKTHPPVYLGEQFAPDVPSREDILAFMRKHRKQICPEALAGHFQVSKKGWRGLEKRLLAMQRDGQLIVGRQGYKVNTQNEGVVIGKVQGHRDGFGFLIPDDGSEDVYLSNREMLKVIHGDSVSVKIMGDNRGRPEGCILEILEYGTTRLVGRLFHEQDQWVVIPEDQRIQHDIFIADSDSRDAEHGQVVVVEIVTPPTRYTPPVGKVIEVLGEIDDPGMEIEIAIRKFEVPVEFSEAALAQADSLPMYVTKADLKGRRDLRDVPFITIDGEDARDFDDAVYAEEVNLGTEKRKRRGWRLLVAIADVSHYVTPKDALDKEALERGTSVYFPRRVIPMLPEVLSNGLCSLNPDVDRLTLVCDMLIPATGAKAGQIKSYQFYPAVIHSHARTTYTQVRDCLQQPDGSTAGQFRHIVPQINDLYALYQRLFEARRQRGAMEFETVETKMISNEQGKIERIVPFSRHHAHRLIEECMLAANTCAADFIRRHHRMGLYRIHEGPTADKLTGLRDFLKHCGLSLGGGATPRAGDYADLLDSARDRPDYHIIQTMVLRSMQQALYRPDNVGHFGLAYEAYTHFTSPIRRYPDLLVHRVIKSILAHKSYIPSVEGIRRVKGEPVEAFAYATWERLGEKLSANERRADEASRDVEAWLKCWYIRERIGEVFSGKVTAVTGFGLFVTLDDLFVEGLIHISELGEDYFNFSERHYELIGERTGQRYGLGDSMDIQVARVDIEARRIDFIPLKRNRRAAAQGREGECRFQRHTEQATALKGYTAYQRRAVLKRGEEKKAKTAGVRKNQSAQKRRQAKQSSRKKRR